MGEGFDEVATVECLESGENFGVGRVRFTLADIVRNGA